MRASEEIIVRREIVMRMVHKDSGVKLIVSSVYENSAFTGWFTEADQPVFVDTPKTYIIMTDKGPQAGWQFEKDMRIPWLIPAKDWAKIIEG